jgi:hypothetical protein
MNTKLLPISDFDISILSDIEVGHNNPTSLILYEWEGKEKHFAYALAHGKAKVHALQSLRRFITSKR